MMVDSVSAEARRKELLTESLSCVYPDDVSGIKQRYKDTSLVLFKEQLSYLQGDNRSYLSFGTRRSSTVSEYGNTPIIVRKSRSTNGELSKVAEQWPSLRGRPSLSNYTLHEAKEKENEEKEEEEETETEDDLEAKIIASVEEGFSSISEEQCQSVERRNTLTVDEETVCKDASEEGYNESAGNRKSFSQYDLPLQRHKEYIDEEEKDEDGRQETIDRENEEDDTDVESMRRLLEVEGVDHKIVLIRSTTNEKAHANPSVNANEIDSVPTTRQECVREIPHKEDNQDVKSNAVPVESHDEIATHVPTSSQVDGALLLSSNVQNSSVVNNVHNSKSETRSDCDGSGRRSSSDWSNIELRIVEPSDMQEPVHVNTQSFNGATTCNNLTSKLLQCGEDDDNNDVVFIDEFSPSAAEVETDLKPDANSQQEVTQVQGTTTTTTTPIPPKRRTKQPSESTSPPLVTKFQASEKHVSKNNSLEDICSSTEAENQNGLLALPIRSPTPPKKSPRRSLRIPKSKNRNHERHSSLELPTSLNQEPSTSKAVVSASPTIRAKDSSRIFNFSLKKERSKSVSSLSLRKNKEKEKVLRSESEDPGLANTSVVSDVDDDKFESSGKRVGVRSMVIDGTIKRNFIVIHPSDDSETIGLAPLASFSNSSRSSVKTSKALSSVKSHITGISSTKIESVKRISSKQELREGLLNTSKDGRDRVSLNATEMVSEKSRHKKVVTSSKKRSESHIHGSSVSLSSSVSHVNSKVLLGSTGGLSEVDCDVVNVSTQSITLSSSKATSRLCVVM